MCLLILVDFSHLYYRAWFTRDTVPQNERVFSQEGRDVTHVKRAFNLFADIISDALFECDADETAVAVCMDGGYGIKAAECPEYKATRKHVLDDENRKEIAQLGAALAKRGASVYKRDGYEADDCVHSLLADYRKDFDRVILYTGDGDLFMHSAPGVMIKYFKNGDYRRIAAKTYAHDIEFLQKRPAVFNDTLLYKALVGDSSDNIKGIRGFGPKAYAKDVVNLTSCPTTYDGVIEVAACLGHTKEEIERSLGMAFPLYVDGLALPEIVDAGRKFKKLG